MQIGIGQPALNADFTTNGANAATFEKLLENTSSPVHQLQANADSRLSDLGEKILDKIQGFVGPAEAFSKTTVTDKPARSPSEEQMKNAVKALEKMFDHSIEVQLVVRGTTQVSGSANTLLRGQ